MTILNTLQNRRPAILALADGTVFQGISIGAEGHTVGEVVFNTAITGYQEILTDPSYTDQIVTLTYPHIGNVGVNAEDQESDRVWAAGLVIRELSPIVSNWRASQSLGDYLQSNNIVAISDIDTRQLTRKLRDQGAMSGCIMAGEIDVEKALHYARKFPGLNGKDLAIHVSTKEAYWWTKGTTEIEFSSKTSAQNGTVLVYDFGVKQQILRLLVDRGFKVRVVPAETSAEDVIALNPRGILLANGPGDPAACHYAIKNIQKLLEHTIPVFGICLGFQLLALALGAKTFKMKFGHHGANHPVNDTLNNKVMITSQNHGFAVDEKTLPSDVQVTHASLFDGTLQGFKHKTKPFLAFQGHPEASPGPHDVVGLFAEFVDQCQKERI
jgi:carbamoyl-phosphate synthase small subunit